MVTGGKALQIRTGMPDLIPVHICTWTVTGENHHQFPHIFNSRGQNPSPSLHVGYFRAWPQLTEFQGSLRYLPRAAPALGARPQLCSCSAGAKLQATAWERRPPISPFHAAQGPGNEHQSLWKFVLPIHVPALFTPPLWA